MKILKWHLFLSFTFCKQLPCANPPPPPPMHPKPSCTCWDADDKDCFHLLYWGCSQHQPKFKAWFNCLRFNSVWAVHIVLVYGWIWNEEMRKMSLLLRRSWVSSYTTSKHLKLNVRSLYIFLLSLVKLFIEQSNSNNTILVKKLISYYERCNKDWCELKINDWFVYL